MKSTFRVVVLASLLMAASGVSAATFVVNWLPDEPDGNPGDGVCDIPAGGPLRCSLRAAIMEANAASSTASHLITFSTGGPITVLGSPLPTITNRVIIDARTAPDYSEGSDVLDSPPSVWIDGSALSGPGDDGLRFLNASLAGVFAMNIINFPDNGIELQDTTLTEISGNWIGLRRDGLEGPNGGSGVSVVGCDRCKIGSFIGSGSPATIENLGNLISLSGEDGVFMQSGNDSEVGGNEIFENGRHGIQVLSPGARIGDVGGLAGGGSITTGNFITANAQDGIRVGANGLRIYANNININGGDGIALDGSDNRIGFVNPAMRNVITSNSGYGIRLGVTLGAANNIIQNQLISQNGLRGIEIFSGTGNEVQQNEILGHSDAIRIVGNDNNIVANVIGLADGVINGGDFNGVVLIGDDNNAANNTIGGMGDDGVDVVSGESNRVNGNRIGMLSDGTNIGNAGVGIRVRAEANDTLIDSNRIGHNFDGIALVGGGSRICGNAIGVGVGNEDAGNNVEGIRVDGGGNVIGDPANGCAGNAIGFNASDGIQIIGDANIVRGNTSGGQPGIVIGNGNSGVFLGDGSDLNDVSDNTLYHNGNDGIRVAAAAGTRNRFDGNGFGNNGDISIDLGDNGKDIEDPQDTDTGPNNLQNSPQFTQLGGNNGQLVVNYLIDSNASSSTYPLTVDFYIAQGSDQQIFRVHRDTYNVSPGAVRTTVFDVPSLTSRISAMVIDAEGNSSELNVAQSYNVPPPPDEIFNDRFELP